MATIVINKQGFRRHNVHLYAPGHAPHFVTQVKSKFQALALGETHRLSLALVVKEVEQAEWEQAQAQAQKTQERRGAMLQKLGRKWGANVRFA